MIPRLLRLSNFFSYRDASLDFSGLSTACICGENGAGKSSLLEAISWSVWGKTRAASEDEIICIGERETRVDFTFESQGQGFRIIRSRRIGQSSSLEFQVETPLGFTTITAKGTKATQQKILETLNLDYDTFINSAYLRQGRADEFMLKRPNDRKQVLADLLKLDRYEALAKKAREVAKQAKVEGEVVERQMAELRAKATELGDTAAAIAAVEDTIAALQRQQESDRANLSQLRDRAGLRQSWQQQQVWLGQQLATNRRDRQQQERDRQQANHRRSQLGELLDRAPNIEAQLAQHHQLAADLEQCDQRCHQYHQWHSQRQAVATQLDRLQADCHSRYRATCAELDTIEQQLADATATTRRADEIAAKSEQLATARDRLQQLDRLQADTAPLEQRCQQLDRQLEHHRLRLESQRDRLDEHIAQLSQPARRQQLETQLQGLATRLQDLERKQVYLQRVREKGLERRGFLDRLEAHKNDWEEKLADIEDKMGSLGAVDTPCPMCDRPLDREHWTLVSNQYEQARKEASDRLWLLHEQMATSKREIEALREEYRQVDRELKDYDRLREQRGQLQAQLNACKAEAERLAAHQTQRAAIAQQLDAHDYAPELHAERQQLQQQLAASTYDERDHTLMRGEVERLRWVEIERAKIEQAMRTIATLTQRRTELYDRRDHLSAERDRLPQDSEPARALAELDAQIATLAYSPDRHNAVRQQLRATQGIFQQVEALKAARQQLPELEQAIATLTQQIADRDRVDGDLTQQLTDLTVQLAASSDPEAEIQSLERTIHTRRTELDRHLAELGRLQQQSLQLEQLNTQIDARRNECDALRYRQRLHDELNRAFGKNGLQALTIETVLPQLEAETNRLLARLSGNQLHVQFVTQKARKRSRSKSSSATTQTLADAPIETLDIFIADTQGTRAYETYSGGEAFRINFAIRLALSRLLAQRSGASLQLLIVDEGFGTQDDRGRERLISAIEAIASDFACILAVTHIPSLKEAFQTRIEITKTAGGSQIQLVS